MKMVWFAQDNNVGDYQKKNHFSPSKDLGNVANTGYLSNLLLLAHAQISCGPCSEHCWEGLSELSPCQQTQPAPQGCHPRGDGAHPGAKGTSLSGFSPLDLLPFSLGSPPHPGGVGPIYLSWDKIQKTGRARVQARHSARENVRVRTSPALPLKNKTPTKPSPSTCSTKQE